MATHDQSTQLADKFWDLQNYITGYVLAQTNAFLMYIGASVTANNAVFRAKDLVIPIIIGSGFLYLIILSICFYLEQKLRLPNNGGSIIPCAITTAFIGRLIAIILVTVVVFIVVNGLQVILTK